MNNVEIIDNKSAEEKRRRQKFAKILFEKQQRNGITLTSALDVMQHRNYFGPMLVETGYADAVLTGLTRNYPDSIRPSLQIIERRSGWKVVSGMYIVNSKEGPYFLSDCTVNKEPSIEELIEITLQTVEEVRRFKIEPRVALLSYSNFGSVRGELTNKLRQVIEILHRDYPDLIVDGEMQASTALNADLMKENFPFSKLKGKPANTLIFPNLTSANITHKIIKELADYEVIGPVLNGMKKPVQILTMGSAVNDIVNMIMVSVMDAHKK